MFLFCLIWSHGKKWTLLLVSPKYKGCQVLKFLYILFQEVNKRVDLRSICVCSVDPPGCTDIDDALHAKPISGTTLDGYKKYEVGVHIADVTHFVRPNTALDKEAALRSTTVYLVDKRIDMVPGKNLTDIKIP